MIDTMSIIGIMMMKMSGKYSISQKPISNTSFSSQEIVYYKTPFEINTCPQVEG
jgi:hypothetical protein